MVLWICGTSYESGDMPPRDFLALIRWHLRPL